MMLALEKIPALDNKVLERSTKIEDMMKKTDISEKRQNNRFRHKIPEWEEFLSAIEAILQFNQKGKVKTFYIKQSNRTN